MAQSVKHLTLGFSSGHHLMVHGFEALIRPCADSTEPTWDSLSPSLSLPLPCPYAHAPSHVLSLKKNKH